ncbi:hypothetical protein SKAU_G00161730 [Synaphobranchus kaupii]|uniref:Uncharacterized protein n=1 Tax=Synaphobranchus kaupii TaxID=118154 RepID=A0A9Q1FIM6_SYNKA|nr:hypothetical protein SKAU_G00161730 [Synaphobranchus kaupii]
MISTSVFFFKVPHECLVSLGYSPGWASGPPGLGPFLGSSVVFEVSKVRNAVSVVTTSQRRHLSLGQNWTCFISYPVHPFLPKLPLPPAMGLSRPVTPPPNCALPRPGSAHSLLPSVSWLGGWTWSRGAAASLLGSRRRRLLLLQLSPRGALPPPLNCSCAVSSCQTIGRDQLEQEGA